MNAPSGQELHQLNITRTTQPPRPRNKPRGLPSALADREVFHLAEPGVVAQELRELLGVVRIDVDDKDRAVFQARLHEIALRSISFSYLDLSVAARLRFRAPHGRIVVMVPASGGAEITVGDQNVPTSAVVAAVVNPDAQAAVRIERPMAFVVVAIERRAVEEHLSRVLGWRIDRPLRFDAEFDLASAASIRWNLALQALHAELSDPESLLTRGVGIGQIEEFMIGSLLYCQPSTFSGLLGGATDTARASVRLAVDYIEQRLAQPVTVPEIAAAAGVSARSLQAHFKADLSQTPLEYVHGRRLDRIRDELRDAVPGSGATVTDVATRWGISHLGRFSVAYHRRFDEHPSDTLRQ